MPLQPRFMDLLVHLAQQPGKVVSKEGILEAVWAKEFVSEGTLTHAVAVIRQALGDDVRSPRYIETIPTRGYRLVAPVAPAEAEPAPEARAALPAPTAARRGVLRNATVFGLLGLVVAGGIVVALLRPWHSKAGVPPGAATRLVVLPFQNLGPAARDYLAQGLTDDITTRLAAARGIGVVSRTTAAYCVKTAQSASQIAKELSVAYILEGTVQWEPERPDGTGLRINARLIRTANDTLVWVDSYQLQLADVVGVGGAIAARVVRQLGVPVRGSERARLLARPTANSDAYQAYLCGMRYHDLESSEQLGLAAAMFERAANLDPSFALACAQLSLVHSRIYGMGIDRGPQRRAEAERWAARALALQPDLPEGHVALGVVDSLVQHDFEGALAQYRIAARELPGETEIAVLLADVHGRQGRWDEAQTELEAAVARDPASYSASLALADTLAPLRAFAGADRAYRAASDIAPDRVEPLVGRFWNALRWSGSADRAQLILNEWPLRDQPVVAYCRSYLAFVRRDFRGALAALAGAGELALPPAFGFPPREVLECLYLDAAGDRAGAAQSCGGALPTLESAVETSSSPRKRLDVALVQATLGRGAEAVREADVAAAAAARAGADENAACLLEQAEVLARAGQAGRAIRLLGRLLARPGPVTSGWLRLDPRWDSLRRDPAFAALLGAGTSAAR